MYIYLFIGSKQIGHFLEPDYLLEKCFCATLSVWQLCSRVLCRVGVGGEACKQIGEQRLNAMCVDLNRSLCSAHLYASRHSWFHGSNGNRHWMGTTEVRRWCSDRYAGSSSKYMFVLSGFSDWDWIRFLQTKSDALVVIYISSGIHFWNQRNINSNLNVRLCFFSFSFFGRCQLSRIVCAKKCSTQPDIIKRFCRRSCAQDTQTARRTPVRWVIAWFNKYCFKVCYLHLRIYRRICILICSKSVIFEWEFSK